MIDNNIKGDEIMKGFFIKFLFFCIILFVIAISFYSIDIKRIRNGEEPKFCCKKNYIQYGGTTEYIGLLYKIIKYDYIKGTESIEAGTIFLKYNKDKVNPLVRDPKRMIGIVRELVIDLDGNYSVVVESNIPYSYYEKVKVYISKSTNIYDENNQKVGTGLIYSGDTLELILDSEATNNYPREAKANTIYILK